MLVIGLDPGLVRTGVAALRDGRVEKVFTIAVEGDPKDTGPRFSFLRRAFELASRRLIGPLGTPDLVALEIPDEDEGVDGVRPGHEKMDVAKLYGAYAVLYAEANRIWPSAQLVSVTPRQWKGPVPKGISERVVRAKYPAARCANSHEWDGVGISDWAWPIAAARASGKNLTAPRGGR
jgi:hypothetical protein